MENEELIKNGNEAVAEALDNMYVILKVDGDEKRILTFAGGDELTFSDKLECDKDMSAVIFGSREFAKKAIEEIIKPQEDGTYEVFQFKNLLNQNDTEDAETEEGFEFDADDDVEDEEERADGENEKKTEQ